MKRFLNYILILVVLVGVFAPFGKLSASQENPYEECNTAQTNKPCTPYFCWDNNGDIYRSGIGSDICYNAGYRWGSVEQYGTGSSQYNPKGGVLGSEKDPSTGECSIWSAGACIALILSKIAFVLMKIASLLVGLGGYLLNTVINQTILNMSSNIDGMKGINIAWKIIRDLMNIAFIFLLIYYGIKLILSQENTGNIQKFIFGIVLASLLINFSLFFTKVIIDSSNIVTIGIYDVISGKSNSPSDENTGISNQIMKALGLQSAWSAPLDLGVQNTDNNYSFLAGNLMATILFLITAFVFLTVSVMFIVRYIVLIYLMALSPIAYMGMALPGLQKNAQEWWKTFMGQIIFAPLFMIMMLVTLKLMSSNFSGANTTALQSASGLKETIDTIFKFSLVIGFTIASLVISKKYSTQGSDYVKKMSDWATSAVTQAGGRAVFGSAAAIGRGTVGAGASRLAQSQRFQNWAGNSWVGEQAIKAARGTAASSFDVRSTRAGAGLKNAIGSDLGKAQEGGYDRTLADKTKKQEAFGQTLRGNAAKENYAARKSGGMFTRGGSNSSVNTVFGVMGRSNRVVSSRILNGQLTPLEANEQNLTNRENQLSQQVANITNEITNLNSMNNGAGPVAGTPQAARLAVLNGPVTTRGSLLNTQDQLATTTANLVRVTAEVARIRGLIQANGLQNTDNRPGYGITNAQTGQTRGQRADEQNY